MSYNPTDQEFTHLAKEVEKLLPATKKLKQLFDKKESVLDKYDPKFPVGSTPSYQALLNMRIAIPRPQFTLNNFIDPKHRTGEFQNLFHLVDTLDQRTQLMRGCCDANGQFNAQRFSNLHERHHNYDDMPLLTKQAHDYSFVVEGLTSLWDNE